MSFVIEQSKAGNDIKTCSLVNKSFTSSENLFKVYLIEEWSIDVVDIGGGIFQGTTIISHGLDYVPAFTLVAEYPEDAGTGEYSEIYTYIVGGLGDFFLVEMDTTTLTIICNSLTTGGPLTINGKCFIFIDDL